MKDIHTDIAIVAGGLTAPLWVNALTGWFALGSAGIALSQDAAHRLPVSPRLKQEHATPESGCHYTGQTGAQGQTPLSKPT